ncbi:MAG TPA: Hsp20/alpha crystallin family protein [Candidatus Sulfotelmatobacter sp.]|nr:Hsp20/alpha crystallin family protein [Candidatus Sulfotelmatobacter sp.]
MKATLVPTTGARWLRNEMDRLFDRVWDGDEFSTMGEWAPRMDVSETPDALTARIEIPGIEPKDVQVLIEHDVLTVKGEKHEEAEQKSEKYLRLERGYGAFTRSVRLPAPVEANKVVATFKNGLLVITMPKAAEAKGVTVPIKLT